MDDDTKIAVVLIKPANPDFQIFIEFVAIEGLAPYIDVGDFERNGNRARVMHRANEFSRREGFVAFELDLADFYFRAFVDVENELYGVGGGDFFVGGFYDGELAAVLGEQLLQDDLSVLDDRGIEAA